MTGPRCVILRCSSLCADNTLHRQPGLWGLLPIRGSGLSRLKISFSGPFERVGAWLIRVRNRRFDFRSLRLVALRRLRRRLGWRTGIDAIRFDRRLRGHDNFIPKAAAKRAIRAQRFHQSCPMSGGVPEGFPPESWPVVCHPRASASRLRTSLSSVCVKSR